MDRPPPFPWQDTPATGERILGAISRIAAVLRTGQWQFATREGLNRTQVEILEILLARGDGVRLGWLAQQLGVTPATASDSIAALTAKGLIEKGRAADDGRAVALRLTAEGSALARRVAGSMAFALDAAARLTEGTQTVLYTGLLALIGKLQHSDRFPEIRACATCRHFVADAHPGAAAPHHCRLVDAALPAALLRLDCPEHEATDADAARANWTRLAGA